MAFQLPNGVAIPASDFSWLGQLATNVTDNVNNKRAGDLILQSLQAKSAAPDASSPQMQVSPSVARTAPVTPVQRSADQGSTYRPFIDTVQKGGLTNPNGLAAVAAYGRAESGWSGDKANATWSDPSQSGQPGTSGGVLSWRGPRLASLQQYAASKGEQGNGSPQTQAEFFLQENPQVVQQLNAAKSPQEANSILAQAWKFAGYDQPGGENARRAALAQNYYAQEFGKNGQPQDPGAVDSGRFASGPIAQGADGMAAALSPPQQQATPVQVADAAPPQQQVQPQAPANNTIAAGITPLTRQNVDPNLIRQMVQNPVTRPLGLQLAQQVLGSGKTQEPWQFVQLPNGDLARANQQTGAIERVGNFAKPDDSTATVGNSLVRKADGKVIFSDGAKAPQTQEFYDSATGQPYKAQWNPQTGAWDKIGGNKVANGETITTNPDGTVTISKGGAGGGKLTEDQGKTAGFLARTNQSEQVLSKLEDQGTSLWNTTAGKVPVLGNYALSADAQKYDQAKRDFVNAILRRESGAAISPGEFDNAGKQYFPQPGDSAEVIAQKRANRAAAIDGLRISAGPAAKRADNSSVLGSARDAIARGADRNAVIKRLQDNGIDPSGL